MSHFEKDNQSGMYPIGRRRWLTHATGAAALLLSGVRAHAQTNFPGKPVRVVVPTAAGSGSDVLARAIADGLSQLWKQPVTIDNRAGGSGIIGVDAVTRSVPDGYTLLITSASPVTINPMVYRKLPYDPARSVIPVSQIGYAQSALLINSSVPATNLSEFILLAKKRPKQLSYGSFGIGSGVHLALEAFCQAAGIELIHIPYKGTSLALNDLLGGQITALLTEPLGALSHLSSGKLKALAVNGPNRHPVLSEIPTFTEQGFPTIEGTYPSFSMFAPFGTPKNIIEKISADMREVLANPDILKRFAPMGYTLKGSTPADLEGTMRQDKIRWAGVIKELGGLTLD